MQLPGPERPGWRVLSIPARAACHHAWRSVTRSTSSAPGKGGGGWQRASSPGNFQGKPEIGVTPAAVTLVCAGVARGERHGPEHPQGSRAGCFVQEAWTQRDSGKARRYSTGEGMAATCQYPQPVWHRGRIRIRVRGGLARTRAGRRRSWGAGGGDPRDTGLGGCVGCGHTLSAALAGRGASPCPREGLSPPAAHGREPAERCSRAGESLRRGQRARGPRGHSGRCRGDGGRARAPGADGGAGVGAAQAAAAVGADSSVFALTAAASRCSERSSAGAASHWGGLGAGAFPREGCSGAEPFHAVLAAAAAVLGM